MLLQRYLPFNNACCPYQFERNKMAIKLKLKLEGEDAKKFLRSKKFVYAPKKEKENKKED